MQPKLQRLRAFYESGVTRTLEFRKHQLLLLKNAIFKYEQSFYDALYNEIEKKARKKAG